MMAQKHLHELLSQDQEPFQLQNYIADRRCQLKIRPPIHKLTTSSTLQSKKLRKPNLQTSSSMQSLCKQACFFSFHDSPDLRKSPFPSPVKSPCKIPSDSNAVFLHIPTKTAAVLLEAAMKIQKQSPNSKSKTQAKNAGFGLFGSILRKLKDKNKTAKPEISLNDAGVIFKGDPFVENKKSTRKMEKLEEHIVGLCVDDKSGNYGMDFSRSCNNSSRLSSAVWSESNEDRSCSTSRSDYTEEIDLPHCEKHFCSSPFRFALQRSPSAGHRTPNFLSPAASPIRHKREEINNQEAENLQLEEDEEKDQCSPVSVLDLPFQEYDDEERDGGDEEGDDDSYDLECSYAVVQRAKLQLLHKLHRFERLAELEPIELEKRMLEEYGDDDLIEEEEECDDVDESRSVLYSDENVDELIRQVLSGSNLCHLKKIPRDMIKRLVLDLVTEEKMKGLDDSNEDVVSMVCNRLDLWKEEEANTIDMMVELDLRREGDGWRSYLGDVAASAEEIERAIFGLLVEEIVS